jgi:hypothetical protein
MPVPARDALEYATRDEFLKLYAVLAGGWVLTLAGQFVAATVGNPVASIVGAIVVLGGVSAFLAGVVAVLHKILAES